MITRFRAGGVWGFECRRTGCEIALRVEQEPLRTAEMRTLGRPEQRSMWVVGGRLCD